MKKLNVSFLILILIVTLLNHTNAQDFQINDTRLGDENVSYVNPEISPVGDYMVWIEIDTTNGFSGQVWHCGLDPDTGDLIPSNGKGFSAFAANVYGRPADWGLDANGPYYVGLNLAGQFVVVRPTGATSANVEVLSTPPDNRRRVIYPSQLPGVDARFMVYILNENVPGWSNNPANNSFELRFMNLDNPNEEITIETQTRTFPSAVGMDVIVPRWIKSTPYLTYGFFDNNNFAQIKEFNAFAPLDSPLVVTNDQNIKTDGHPINNPFNNKQYIVSGFGGGESALVYRRNQPSQSFVSIETITTPTPNLLNPTLNQSHEPFFFDDQLYTTFQVNEDGGTFLDTTWNEPGEIWITSIDDLQQNMWLINDFDTELNISEPEPYTGNDKIFVYYSGKAIDPSQSPLNQIFHLRRCETPMNSILSINDNNYEHWINIHPNPSNDIIKIDTDFNVEISLFDFKGQLLLKELDIKEVDISAFSSGHYIIVAEKPGFRVVKKIVKN